MKILLQHRGTKLFLGKLGDWTRSESDAALFATALAAFRYSEENYLGDTEVIFRTRHPALAAQSVRWRETASELDFY
ncbi:MAG: hypothetical protein JWO95_3037 [Verrucomicrobiales bacterium]|nr:hypothetical protein [Verrucomicrobiales bacterium]